MKRIILAIAILLVTTAAEARGRHHHHHHYHHRVAHDANGNDARPRAWCGWYMRQILGVRDVAYNLARNWARWGRAARGPAPGVIGVMPHHVFVVEKVIGPGRVIATSGNDGGAVQTRERSTKHVIAWRVAS